MGLEGDEKSGKESQLGSCYNGPAESLGRGSGHGEGELELGEGECTGSGLFGMSREKDTENGCECPASDHCHYPFPCQHLLASFRCQGT